MGAFICLVCLNLTSDSYNPSDFRFFDDKLYFSAENGELGRELCAGVEPRFFFLLVGFA